LQNSNGTQLSTASLSGEEAVSAQIDGNRINAVANPVSSNVELVGENVTFLNDTDNANSRRSQATNRIITRSSNGFEDGRGVSQSNFNNLTSFSSIESQNVASNSEFASSRSARNQIQTTYLLL
jgi:hypothetical protein